MHREPTRGIRSAAVATAIFTVTTLLSGCVVEIPLPNSAAAARPYELWITDAGAPLKSLELSVAKVFVGKDQLHVKTPTFDLLKHMGIEEGFLLASGQVSSEEPEPIRIVFDGAVADFGGSLVNLRLPGNVLVITPERVANRAGEALLLDINATQSLKFDGEHLNFVPHVDGAFAADLPSRVDGQEPDEPVFQPEASLAYGQSVLVANPADLIASSDDPIEDTLAAATSPFDAAVAAVATATLPAGGASVADLDPDADVKGWFVHFDDDVPEYRKALILEAHGASLLFSFSTIPVGYALARDDQAWSISQSEHVTYVEADRPVEFLLQTSRMAIRQPLLADPLVGIKDPAGQAIDGRGIGLAVVDIGIDGTHPDLLHWSLAATGTPVLEVNYKVESIFTLDVPTTDDAAGHGTHVAGIAAGRGVLDPTQKGVAPAAALYAFGVGEADTTLWTNQALDWIVQNHDKVDPPIRVVSNSWMTLSRYDANSAVVKLVNNLVAEGVVVVFAAGNRGGDGSTLKSTTSGECQIPTPGVICVAAFDDLDLGTRDGKIASYSSRGSQQIPFTWPDVSAPGSRIRSAAPVVGTTTLVATNSYTNLQGTSMAAPHVSGIAALMLQAKPGLTPAQVETILESTAYKYADGGAYASSGSHFAKGHGLVDAYAAVAAARFI